MYADPSLSVSSSLLYNPALLANPTLLSNPGLLNSPAAISTLNTLHPNSLLQTNSIDPNFALYSIALGVQPNVSAASTHSPALSTGGLVIPSLPELGTPIDGASSFSLPSAYGSTLSVIPAANVPGKVGVVPLSIRAQEVEETKRRLEEQRKELERQKEAVRLLRERKQEREITLSQSLDKEKEEEIRRKLAEARRQWELERENKAFQDQAKRMIDEVLGNAISDEELRKKIEIEQMMKEKYAERRKQWQIEKGIVPTNDDGEVDIPPEAPKEKSFNLLALITGQGKETLQEKQMNKIRAEEERKESERKEKELNEQKEKLLKEQKLKEEKEREEKRRKILIEQEKAEAEMKKIEEEERMLKEHQRKEALRRQQEMEMEMMAEEFNVELSVQKKNDEEQRRKLLERKAKEEELKRQINIIEKQLKTEIEAKNKSANLKLLSEEERIRLQLERMEEDAKEHARIEKKRKEEAERAQTLQIELQRKKELGRIQREKEDLELKKKLGALEAQKQHIFLEKQAQHQKLAQQEEERKRIEERQRHEEELERIKNEVKKVEDAEIARQRELLLKQENEARMEKLKQIRLEKEALTRKVQEEELAAKQKEKMLQEQLMREQEILAKQRLQEMKQMEEFKRKKLEEQAEIERLERMTRQLKEEELRKAREAEEQRIKEEERLRKERLEAERKAAEEKKRLKMEAKKKAEEEAKEMEELRKKVEQETLMRIASTNPLMNPMLINTINPLNQAGFHQNQPSIQALGFGGVGIGVPKHELKINLGQFSNQQNPTEMFGAPPVPNQPIQSTQPRNTQMNSLIQSTNLTSESRDDHISQQPPMQPKRPFGASPLPGYGVALELKTSQEQSNSQDKKNIIRDDFSSATSVAQIGPKKTHGMTPLPGFGPIGEMKKSTDNPNREFGLGSAANTPIFGVAPTPVMKNTTSDNFGIMNQQNNAANDFVPNFASPVPPPVPTRPSHLSLSVNDDLNFGNTSREPDSNYGTPLGSRFGSSASSPNLRSAPISNCPPSSTLSKQLSMNESIPNLKVSTNSSYDESSIDSPLSQSSNFGDSYSVGLKRSGYDSSSPISSLSKNSSSKDNKNNYGSSSVLKNSNDNSSFDCKIAPRPLISNRSSIRKTVGPGQKHDSPSFGQSANNFTLDSNFQKPSSPMLSKRSPEPIPTGFNPLGLGNVPEPASTGFNPPGLGKAPAPASSAFNPSNLGKVPEIPQTGVKQAEPSRLGTPKMGRAPAPIPTGFNPPGLGKAPEPTPSAFNPPGLGKVPEIPQTGVKQAELSRLGTPKMGRAPAPLPKSTSLVFNPPGLSRTHETPTFEPTRTNQETPTLNRLPPPSIVPTARPPMGTPPKESWMKPPDSDTPNASTEQYKTIPPSGVSSLENMIVSRRSKVEDTSSDDDFNEFEDD